jgi:GNAT superfamily N-acetyltransferase
MQPSVRPGRLEDHAAIAAWTRDTFAWGDYVGRAFPEWVRDPGGRVFVAEVDGRIVGVARVTMLSDQEAWSQGARVHPEFRRRGIGLAIGEQIERWAVDEGARVIRLAVENWNRAARSHVERMGFREAGDWVMAERGVGDSSPVPEGNGGRRVMAPEGLRPAASGEIEPAMLSWISGPLERASRGLIPVGWSWRRFRPADLAEAARRRALWEGRPGWAIAEVEDDTFRVSWISTTEQDARAMMRALVDRAAAAGVDRLEVMIPDVDWLRRALRRLGVEAHPLTIYDRTLGGRS